MRRGKGMNKEKIVINENIWVKSEEVRQYVYCKTIPYFRKYLNFKPKIPLELGLKKTLDHYLLEK